MSSYLDSHVREECSGCEACVQVCNHSAIKMVEDCEGFRYPEININTCTNCGLCRKVCPYTNPPIKHKEHVYTFGGYHKNANIKDRSTSGGAFTAIATAWCDKNYVIFGAKAVNIDVFHSYITDINQIDIFRKSKYAQSHIGNSYKEAKIFLKEGRKVLFSGTPCQIAGLKTFLGNKDYSNLLTVEVVCEGVPSAIYIRKYNAFLQQKYGSPIKELDYRYTDSNQVIPQHSTKLIPGKWDFQVMRTILANGKTLKIDRWFNPFWSIWLQHLMSRPSCYECPFATPERNADITLGDLWGVHLYCPELYGRNGGASLIVCNTPKGKAICTAAATDMYGHELNFTTALKYQSPMRKHIDFNNNRTMFMQDLIKYDYPTFTRKWAIKPSFKLLWQKYIWGNRQKIWWWNLTNKQ